MSPACARCGRPLPPAAARYRIRTHGLEYLACAPCWSAKGRRPEPSNLVPNENASPQIRRSARDAAEAHRRAQLRDREAERRAFARSLDVELRPRAVG